MKRIAVVLSVMVFFACQLSAVEVLNSDYAVEPYASYTKPGLKTVMSLAFDGGGNLYLSHAYESIWKVTPEGNASEFVKGVSVRGLVWGGGTAFGDYLYSPNGLSSGAKINRIALNGAISSFASFDSPKHNPAPIAIDTIGNYGGAMFTATSGQDRTYRVTSSGVVSLFADFPGWRDGGGPSDLVFDKTGNYGNQLYMATSFSNVAGNESMSGLWKLAPNGQATRLIPEKVFPACLDIDNYGDFNGKMYALARTTLEGVNEIWVVEPDGSHSVFAKTTQTGICDLIFGADGAMYVAEYVAAQEKIVISKVVLDNANLIALEIAGPNEVAEDTETQYRAVAYYDNGRNRDVTNKVRWFTDNCDFAGVDANGLFWCEKVFTFDTVCRIDAEIGDVNNILMAQKQIKILPGCTKPELIKRNLGMARQVKADILADLNYALKAETASQKMLMDMQREKDFSLWKIFDIVRARVYTQIAVLKEYLAKEKIQSSDQDLSNALKTLEEPEKKIKDKNKP